MNRQTLTLVWPLCAALLCVTGLVSAEEQRRYATPDEAVDALISAAAADFPIPLVRDEQGWRFDTLAGTEELLDRRVGRNELHAIAVMRALVEAQHEYAAEDRNGDGVTEFASKMMSSEGAEDGLYWPPAEDGAESPIGRLVAEAVAKGYGAGDGAGTSPYQGSVQDTCKK